MQSKLFVLLSAMRTVVRSSRFKRDLVSLLSGAVLAALTLQNPEPALDSETTNVQIFP